MLDVRVGIDFRVRGGTECCDLLSIGFGREKKQPHVRVVAWQMAERVYEIRRDRFVRLVRTAIGVAPRDGIVKFAFFAFSRCEIHAGHELWFGFSGNRAEFSWLKRRGSCVAVGRRSEHQILQSTTHADVFFAQIRIERADVPLGVDVQLNRGIGDLE